MKRIFITGGASGLGRALAERYAREKWSVCIGDVHETRGGETLTALKSLTPRAHFLKCDVTSDADLENALNWLVTNWGGIDVVVNNAGVATSGPMHELPLKDWAWIVDINLMGVVRGCKIFSPLLIKQGRGTIINIASIAGLVYVAGGASYNATKAAVIALSETMRLELAPKEIQVSVVCPYFFRTNLTETLRSTSAAQARMTEKFVKDSRMDAATIADRVYRAANRGDFMIFPDFMSRVLSRLKRFMPAPLFFWILSFQLKRLRIT